jgi:hypothetical protein
MTKVKHLQIIYLLCQQGHASLLAAEATSWPFVQTLGLNVKLACLERNKTIFHSKLLLHNRPLMLFRCFWTGTSTSA